MLYRFVDIYSLSKKEKKIVILYTLLAKTKVVFKLSFALPLLPSMKKSIVFRFFQSPLGLKYQSKIENERGQLF